MAMSGSVQSASPASAPPGRTCSTPFGSPASSKMRAMMKPPVSAVRGSGFEHHRVAGGERRGDRAARQDQGEVERRDDADDAARQTAGEADTAGIGRQHQALRLGAHGGGAIEDFRHHVDFESGLGRDAAGLARDPRDQFFLIVFEARARPCAGWRRVVRRGSPPSRVARRAPRRPPCARPPRWRCPPWSGSRRSPARAHPTSRRRRRAIRRRTPVRAKPVRS